MACCNQIIKKTINITQGQISALAEGLFNIEILKCSDYDQRIDVCNSCSKRTYYSKYEYMEYLLRNGLSITANFVELENLPPLEYKPSRHDTLMCCRLCKCILDAKCRVQDEKCPLGRWHL